MHNTYRGWEEMKIYLKLHENFILFHFIWLCHKRGVTKITHANYCGCVLRKPPCKLSLLEDTGVPGENPQLSTER